MIALLLLGSVVAQGGVRMSSVVVDATNPETVYAVGANWKAELGAGGVQFTPFLGSDAPRNEYVRFAPSRVTVDGVALASSSEAGVECAGNTLLYERGAFDEVFDARFEGLEHRLSFSVLPTRGELVVRCNVDSSLTARQADDAIEFTNERGRVRYPSAIAFDAAGRRITLATHFVDSALVLTVPAEFVAQAVLPLTIDPLIQVLGVATGPTYDFAPDAALQWGGPPGGPYRCEVFETAWSAVDHDITARLTRISGTTATTLLVDATTEYWSQAKVASLIDSKLQARFLVVAAAGLPSSGARLIQGRHITLLFSGITLGPVTLISAATGDNHHPDVGGDPYAPGGGTGSYFAVVHQRDLPGGDTDIYGGRVGSVGPIAVDPLADDENPRMSKANGTTQWCFVWERTASPGNRDIWASTLTYQAAGPSAPFQLTNAPEDETNPSVSSPGVPGFGYAVAYERDMGGQRDIFVQAFLVAVTGAPINFTQLEGGTHQGLDQQWPVVDGDYDGHVLAYRDDDPVTPGLKRTRFTSFNFSPAQQIVLHEVRHSLGNPGINRTAANVCAHSAALFPTSPPPRFEIVWDEVPGPGDNDVFGALFVDGATSGGVESACYGDGSITACPCVSNGGAPAGCPNSSQPTGGELQWTGDAKVSVDTFVIQALRLTPNAPVALAGGSVFNANGIVYGDGLLCLSGSLTRLVYRVTSATGTLTYPEFVTDPRISIAGGVSGGVTQSYQLVYRDSPAFCTPGTFNTTNALVVSWAP